MLCGNEESVFKDFEEDRGESKFSKEKAVTLIIQLTEKRYLKLIVFYTQLEGWWFEFWSLLLCRFLRQPLFHIVSLHPGV